MNRRVRRLASVAGFAVSLSACVCPAFAKTAVASIAFKDGSTPATETFRFASPISDTPIVNVYPRFAVTLDGSALSLDLFARAPLRITNGGGDLRYDESRFKLHRIVSKSDARKEETSRNDDDAAKMRSRIVPVSWEARRDASEQFIAHVEFRVLDGSRLERNLPQITRLRFEGDSAIPMRGLAETPILNVCLTSENRTTVGRVYSSASGGEYWIPYQLAREAAVALRIYTATGALVRTIKTGVQEAGPYVNPDRAVYWDRRALTGDLAPDGLYFYEFRADSFVQTGALRLGDSR